MELFVSIALCYTYSTQALMEICAVVPLIMFFSLRFFQTQTGLNIAIVKADDLGYGNLTFFKSPKLGKPY
jgi:hypothetical protein